jgi:hypothetical protein
MIHYCLECKHKLRDFKVITDVERDLLATTVSSQRMFICDNHECSRYGLLSEKGYSEPDKLPETNQST